MNAPTPMELDADTVAALGLDPTGRDLAERFPYTLENLTDEELLLLLFLSSQAESYPDEAEAPETGLWYEATNRVARDRFGEDKMDDLAEVITGSHASIEDCIDTMRRTPESFTRLVLA